MAITSIIAATTDAASGASTEFTVTGSFWLYGDYFNHGESATLERVGPSGDYIPATNVNRKIQVTAVPNTVFVDLPAGTYRINKTVTSNAASVGYEESI